MRNTLKKITKYSGLEAVAIRLGIKSPIQASQVAMLSAKATEARKTAETAAYMGALGAGTFATLAVAGVASGPLAPAFLGLGILLTVVLRQKGLNQELRANLIAIQLEADSFFMITSVVEEIAKENGIDLNTRTVKFWITKLTNFVTLLAGPDTMKLVTDERKKLQGTIKGVPAALNSSKASGSTWTSFLNRMLSPGEYLRILIREVIITHIFFSIMMGEFDLFMRAKGETATKKWINSDAYKLLLATNKANQQRAIGVASKNAIDNHNAKFKEFYSPAVLDAAVAAIGRSETAVEAAQDGAKLKGQIKAAEAEQELTIGTALETAGVPLTPAALEALGSDSNPPSGASSPGSADELLKNGGARRTRKKLKKNRRH